ncbi:transcriptional repressor ILP1 [Coffea eugenioides]|uniref:transcriptional repressor ILP1 n=1 Tax=Coffea eugenioides TaxID=49369 RepID=UPI000F605B4A|nr:transcriptional repressor ILP1 [Coffea eugenioides]
MSSKARNFRRRGGDGADDDEDNDKSTKTSTTNGSTTTSSKPQFKSISSASRPKKPVTAVPKSRLSFADDEEADADQLPIKPRPSSSNTRLSRPSSSSSSHHKLSSSKNRIGPQTTASLPSNVQPQAGTYTKEALLELQKNTRTLASSRSARPEPPKSKPEVTPTEPVIVLKGLVKPKPNMVDDADGEIENDEMGVEQQGDLVRTERDEAKFRLGLRGKSEVSGGVIPDQATIDAIRAKRERLRQAGPAAQDYISLDGGSNHGEAEGLSDEEPEFRGRIGFFGAKIDGGKKGVFEDFEERVTAKDSAVLNSDDEDEEELEKLWEEEQARKGLGLGKRLDDGVSVGVSSSTAGGSSVNVPQSVPQQKFGFPIVASGSVYSSVQISSVDTVGPSIGGAVGGLPGSDEMPISQKAELAKKVLYDNVKMLKESHKKTMDTLTRNDENLSASLLNVTKLENSLSAAGEKFIFMQKLREFVSVICDFLQHKAPFIEELEDQMQKLHEERAAAILERRIADNNDEMKELEPAVSAAMSVFRKGGSSAAMIESAISAAQAASAVARELRDLPVELDELGRDLNLQKRMDLARRAEARQYRKAKSDSKRLLSMEIDSPNQPMEGESSTDESDSESTAYQSSRDQLLQISEQIFSDAADDYAQLSAVVERFERWKKEYASSYRDAYMSLSAPTIFSPYVRLELLKWDPLHEDSDFIHMKWHSLLFDYGPEDDADANLIPELVEKLAIPILHHQLVYCWDMLSTRETEYAVSATNLVLGYVPPSSLALGNLVAALRDRLADAVTNLMVPTWNTLVLKAVPNAARAAAYRFGVSVRLMKNICRWHKVLARPVLEKLALDELLIGKILPHLRSIESNIHDAVTRTERVVASLDGVWAGPSVTGDRSPKLLPLVEFLLSLGRTLEKRHVSGGIQTETAKLARRLKKMLVELNEYDQARAILRTFSLKEAL